MINCDLPKIMSIFSVDNQELNYWSLVRKTTLYDKGKRSLLCSPFERTVLNEILVW